MIGLRVGAILAARKKGHNYSLTSKYEGSEEELKDFADCQVHEVIKDMDIKENTR